MAGERVTLVVPFRVRFAAHSMVDWVSGALPVFWHHWSEATDIRRIPPDRRWRILWKWWLQRPRTLPVPLEAKAVEWWLSRRMRGGDWEWDPAFVSELRGESVGGEDAAPLGSETLRPALREFLCPEAFARFLEDSLSKPFDDQYYLPPVSALHLRLGRLDAGRPGWVIGESGDRHEVEWTAVRMHMFRFGDGFLSLSFEATDDSGLAATLQQASRHPDGLRLGFSGEPLLLGQAPPESSYRELIQQLLTPGEPYEPELPDREQWTFVWGDDTRSSEEVHRIEMPLLSRLPMLVVQGPVEPGGAEGAAGDPEAASPPGRVDGPLIHLKRPAGLDLRAVEARTLGLLLLALFRHLKVSEVAELLATPRGRDRLESAHYLQYLSYHMSLVHDRFQMFSPVFGGWAQWMWNRLDEEWHLDRDQQRVSRAIQNLREDYFRGLSLRLIARVTSTFWFLFRWILVPLLLAGILTFVVSSLIIAAAGMLTLSLFATVAVLLASHLHGRIKKGDEQQPAGKTKGMRTDWVMIAAVVEVAIIAVAVILSPELARHLLPLAATFAGLLVLITGVGFWTLRKRWRRDTVARFYLRETVPIVAVVLAVLALLGLLLVLGFVVNEYGAEILQFRPSFDKFTEALPATDGGSGNGGAGASPKGAPGGGD